ncbi:sigma-54 interaction domain-containing protein [Sideroxydans lithotrophicus]|uniref:PAS modulated sigma54 specific transcriptional regulator, Fis family n=1 Tax=Sideroxydans lithotrophicus (strain ES-1) TaxID=580332 RepID=D5CR05_SIDLE|nr:sigma-54-dependent Fis family transcriptional regulator [Sideroxydans lithotrophicus]ADE11391.1 PAS modulated sigma54 specific transcriptional regulator, Fis family [Sideroxydans lithotrophicus ES-1]
MSHSSISELMSYLDTLAEPRIVLDRSYNIIGANRAYLSYYHVGDLPIAGRHCYEVSHRYKRPCDEEGESCPLKSSLQSGQPHRVLHIHHTVRGDEHVDVELTPIRNAEGEIEYFVEMIHTVRAGSALPEGELVGRSAAFNRMLEQVTRVAPSQADVLLLGESGTGKELVAHAVHDASKRATGPFVAVDCSSLPENLFESELFGYEKGAFSGANQRKQGLVEAASGGTLFLDEVGDIPLGLQVKLLRLLETGTYRRVGGVEPLRSDFRLVAATHRDLKKMIAEGSFRRDLYYRISTFPILLPSLSERMEDLPLLMEALLKRISTDHAMSIHPATLLCLSKYDFPGNIRELRNLIERATLLADGDVLLPEHFPDPCEEKQDSLHSGQSFSQVMTLEEMEKSYLEWQVRNSGLGRRELAERLGIGERTLFRKLGKLTKI